ncbi:MAG: ergothioneine biosynthesis protein EgtB [Crocinitomicaceae bacterium]
MPEHLKEIFNACRLRTEEICSPLKTEDYSVQPMVDVSPPKWHLAHSTWFFEQFVLCVFNKEYKVFSDDFAYLFNSYYNNVGKRVLRPNRGNMTRPVVEEVYDYRRYVTEQVNLLLDQHKSEELAEVLTLGINHEQQHQELLIYDIKYILGNQPTFPTYSADFKLEAQQMKPTFHKVEGGLYTIGHSAEGFCFDNELGAHQVYLEPFEISNQLVTNGEYLEFIEAGGYEDFNLWHAEGWDFIQNNSIKSPLYWHQENGKWSTYDMTGFRPLELNVPVSHISMYEAYAFAEWKGMRLPTEFEWEVASNLFEWGQLWEWTNSAYLPYPKFSKAPGAIGEYNGKFMINQMVLRGASIATAKDHSRHTYRNFFPASMRWLFNGIRLAK